MTFHRSITAGASPTCSMRAEEKKWGAEATQQCSNAQLAKPPRAVSKHAEFYRP